MLFPVVSMLNDGTPFDTVGYQALIRSWPNNASPSEPLAQAYKQPNSLVIYRVYTCKLWLPDYLKANYWFQN